MHAEEYADFGPPVFFRTMLLKGYSRLVDEVAERPARLAAGI